MTAPPRTERILVIANRTASTPRLLDVVADRRHSARFTLLIPPEHGNHHGPDWTVEEASELLSRSAGTEIATLDAGSDALDTIHEAVGDGEFDQIIVCTPEEH